jgi:hypothetical protein
LISWKLRLRHLSHSEPHFSPISLRAPLTVPPTPTSRQVPVLPHAVESALESLMPAYTCPACDAPISRKFLRSHLSRSANPLCVQYLADIDSAGNPGHHPDRATPNVHIHKGRRVLSSQSAFAPLAVLPTGDHFGEYDVYMPQDRDMNTSPDPELPLDVNDEEGKEHLTDPSGCYTHTLSSSRLCIWR